MFTAFLTLWVSAELRAAMAPESIMGKDDWSNRSFVIKAWMNYSGPQITDPNQFTTSRNGEVDTTFQHSDTVLTGGYHVSESIVPGFGVPIDLIIGQPDVQVKAPFFGIIEAKIYHEGNLTLLGDLRFYLPLGDVAQTEDFKTAVRTSQTVVYSVPGSRLVLGTNTSFRLAKYGKHGTGPRREIEFVLAPFLKQGLTRTLSFTTWSGLIQLGQDYGKPPGLRNYPISISPGLRWDFSSEASINPYVSFLPSNVNATTVGFVLNARLL